MEEGNGVTFSPLTNVPLVEPRSITYGRTILVDPSSVSFSVKRNWITACCGGGAVRSARDAAEMPPRCRRDAAEMPPRRAPSEGVHLPSRCVGLP